MSRPQQQGIARPDHASNTLKNHNLSAYERERDDLTGVPSTEGQEGRSLHERDERHLPQSRPPVVDRQS